MPPVGLAIAVSAASRRTRDEDRPPTRLRSGWSSDRIEAADRRLREENERGEAALVRAMTVILLLTVAAAAFMAWAWLYDTARI